MSEKLKEAVWQEWLYHVKGAKGSSTVTELIEQYGFTGNFTGLNKHMTRDELIDDLQDIFGE